MRPYKVVSSNSHTLGRFDVHMDQIEIAGKRYPYSYTCVKESVCVLPFMSGELVWQLVQSKKWQLRFDELEDSDALCDAIYLNQTFASNTKTASEDKNLFDEDYVVLVYQYRHAIDKWILEMAAGSVESHEKVQHAAQRELLEETGMEISESNLISLGYCYPVSGTSNEKMHLYAGRVNRIIDASPEPSEYIGRRLIPVSVFEKMIADGSFQNMYGMALWCRYQYWNQ